MLRFVRVGLVCLSVLALAACKTAEERAEEFYQSGLVLIEAGDLDRAAIEFLNVFQHDGFHQDARRKLADIRLEQGDIAAAYSQYLRLIEQYPDTAEVRLILAGIAVDISNWDEARRHSTAALELLPDDPLAQTLAAASQYNDATQFNDNDGRNDAVLRAQTLLGADPTNDVARRVVVDDMLRNNNSTDAMREIDYALARAPEDYDYNTLRLGLLMQSQDMGAIGTQLQHMVALFPDDQELAQSLISWYLSQGDLEGAEDYLRQLAGPLTGPSEPHIAVVQLIQATQGPQAAKQELDRLAEANTDTPNAQIYRSLSAVINFEAGQQDAAFATFREILEGAEPDAQTSRLRNMLARLLITAGQADAAEIEVARILENDATNVDALKLRAAWSIEDDRADQAILDLRTALSTAPRDSEILTLMAQAHEREGSLALAGERLALAVDLSGSAPAESLRYANFLINDGRISAARSVLTEAQSTTPRNVDVTFALVRLLISEGAWVEAQNYVGILRTIATPQAVQAATSAQAALLLGQNKTEDGLAFLQETIDQGNTSTTAISQIVQIHLQSGDIDTARSYLSDAIRNHPDDADLRMLDASVLAIVGEFAQAETTFRALISEFPQAEGPVLRLYNLLMSTDQSDEAKAVIDAAIVAQPQSLNLRWIRAGQLEKMGDIDGAINLYEEMYAVNSGAVAIANNLASLISTHKDDPESLARAATIAKRLSTLDVPPFQDTYGWIAYRQDNFEKAREYLEPAAEGLPNDPLVQFHLGMTYAALNQTDRAKELLARALELAGDSDLPQFAVARQKLQELGN